MTTDTRDDTFYWQKWIVFKISGSETRFCLPQNILSILPNLADMFTMPPHQEGSSDEHPIIIALPSPATVDDFRAFLVVLMPALPYNIAWDVDAWIGVLRIANWAMLDYARDTAIHQLDSVVRSWPPTQLYQFAHEHRVIEWHIHAVKEFLSRPDSMSTREVKELGSHFVVRIMNLRFYAERAANVRVYNQMHLHMRGLVQRLYTENQGVMTMNQLSGLLDPLSELVLRYRAALPSVMSLQGHRWVKEIKDEFVLEHFPVEFI